MADDDRNNWFVALPVAPGAWFAPLVADVPPKVRVFHPDDLHMTVAFLGRVGLDRALAAWSLAADLAALPFDIELGSLVAMGNPRRPSALSLEIERGRDAAVAVIAALGDRMVCEAGGEPDPRTPRPHVTVARPRRAAGGAERRRAVAWASSKPPVRATVHVDRLALYTASEDRQERQFRIVEERPLGAGK